MLTVESLAIILVIGIMSYMFVRSGRAATGLAVLPLIVVPLLHLLGAIGLNALASRLPFAADDLMTAIDVIALVITCLLLGGISRSIKTKAYRRGYILLCSGFSLVLTLVYVFNSL